MHYYSITMKRYIISIVIAVLLFTGCATYIDKIVGTEITFPEEKYVSRIYNELPEDEKYIKISVLNNSEHGDPIDEFEKWEIRKIEATRTRNEIDRTMFSVTYFLESSAGEMTEFKEERISYSKTFDSMAINNVFIEHYYPESYISINDSFSYGTIYTYRSDNYFVRFGDRYNIMRGTEVWTNCSIFSNVGIPNNSQISVQYFIGDTMHLFLPSNQFNRATEGPFEDYKEDVNIKMRLAGSDITAFVITVQVLNSYIKDYSENSQNTTKEEIFSDVKVQLEIGNKTIELEPNIMKEKTRNIEYDNF